MPSKIAIRYLEGLLTKIIRKMNRYEKQKGEPWLPTPDLVTALAVCKLLGRQAQYIALKCDLNEQATPRELILLNLKEQLRISDLTLKIATLEVGIPSRVKPAKLTVPKKITVKKFNRFKDPVPAVAKVKPGPVAKTKGRKNAK